MKMIKRLAGAVLAFSMLTSILPVNVPADELETKLKINTEWQSYDKPLILHIIERGNYQLLAPARPFFEALGAELEWDGESKSITFTKDDFGGVLTVDSDIALKNGEETTLPAAPQLVDGISYVPVEFCGDALDYHVLREKYGRIVRIYNKTSTVSTKYDGTVKPGMAELVSEVHRPVPTEFEKSNNLNVDDLIFFREHEYVPREQMEAEKEAALDPSTLPQGEVIYTMDDIFESTPEGNNWAGWVKHETIDDPSVPFNKVLRLNCTIIPQNRVEYIVKPDKLLPGPIAAEDKYLVKYYVRLVSGGNVDTGIGHLFTHIERDLDWYKGYMEEVDFGEEWKVVYGLMTGVEGSNHIGFTPGQYRQTFDIGGFEIQKLPRDADVSMLIKHSKDIDYATPELSRDAPWRQEALDRIEQVRKGDFKVVVRDKDGNPVPNADVKFDMFEHEFKLSVTLDGDSWMAGIGLADKDMKAIAPVFNGAGCGNDQKLSQFDSNRFNSRRILDDAKNMGLKYFRGHAIWMPALERGVTAPYRFNGDGQVEALDYETFMKYVKEHINRIVQTMPDIYEWDVTNEMTGRVTFDKFGKISYMEDIYRYCAEVFPDGMDLALCGNETGHEQYWEILDAFQRDNIPLDVIALQNHWGTDSTVGFTDMMAIYDRFVYEYGKQFSLTEFSMHQPDGDTSQETYDRAGDIVRDFIIAVFSHPGANAINCFWLSDSWSTYGVRPAVLYKENIEPKPAYYQWCDLFYNKFWTRDAHITTDSEGRGTVRGFYGDYDVTVSIDGKEVKATMAAFHRGYENELTITLD